MTHRYKAGQMLELRASPRVSNRPAGPCEVIFCMPHDRGPILYRVKSLSENTERVVDEVDLAPSGTTKSANFERQDAFSIAVARQRPRVLR